MQPISLRVWFDGRERTRITEFGFSFVKLSPYRKLSAKFHYVNYISKLRVHRRAVDKLQLLALWVEINIKSWTNKLLSIRMTTETVCSNNVWKNDEIKIIYIKKPAGTKLFHLCSSDEKCLNVCGVCIAYRISLLVFPYAIMELKSIHIREVRILFDGNNIRNESLLDCAPPVIKTARAKNANTNLYDCDKMQSETMVGRKVCGMRFLFGVCNKIIHLLSSLEEIIRCVMLWWKRSTDYDDDNEEKWKKHNTHTNSRRAKLL